MPRRFFFPALVAMIATIPLSAQSLEQVLAKHYEALGGLQKIQAVKTARYSGKIEMEASQMGPAMELPFVMEMNGPASKFRLDVTVQDTMITEAYDGKAGWRIMPFDGSVGPVRMPSEESKFYETMADFGGPVAQSTIKGHKVELLGKARVGDLDAYKLKVTTKAGCVITCYLDAKTYLEIKEESKTVVNGMEMNVDSMIGNYKSVGGLMLPQNFEMDFKGMMPKRKILSSTIDLNPAVDDARFSMPETKKPDAAPAVK